MNKKAGASTPEKNAVYCTSWSGGKDGCFAHWQALQGGATPGCLLTMLKDDGQYTSAHGLSREVLEAQADCAGLPILFGQAGFGQYEAGLKTVLADAHRELHVRHMVFGDIDLQAHKDWYEKILSGTGIAPHFPLWHYDREQVVYDLLKAGIETMIISLKEAHLDKRFLGQIITPEVATAIKKAGVCPTGEEGEFHTVVINAPWFNQPLSLKEKGFKQDEWGHTMLDVVPR